MVFLNFRKPRVYLLLRLFIGAAVIVPTAQSENVFERLLQASAKLCVDKLTGRQTSVHSALFSQYPLPQQQIDTGLKRVDAAYLRQTLFVLPKNDGEAVRAYQILLALKAPNVHVSQQSWGASIDREGLPHDVLSRVQRVVIFEMPGVEGEARLKKSGKEVVIVDHHGSELFRDRYKNVSSLEQLAEILSWPMSEEDRAIAINDRGYIHGLRSMGLSEPQIRAVRNFDLQSQGRVKSAIDQDVTLAQNLIPFLPTQNGVTIYSGEKVDPGILQQELAILHPNGIANFLSVTGGVRFSGQADVVEHLKQIQLKEFGLDPKHFDMYHGGDAAAGSMFFRIKYKAEFKGRPFPPALLDRVQNIVLTHSSLSDRPPLKPGAELAYETYGDPQHPAIVLIHGLDGSGVTFSTVIDALAKDYYVITYDQRGHGQSQAVGTDYSTTVLAKDLLALMDHLKVARAHVLGHSLGARTAVRFAALYPERVDHLIIEDMTLRSRGASNAKDNQRLAENLGRRRQVFASSIFASPLELARALEPFYGSEAASIVQRRATVLPDGRVQLLFRPDVSLIYGVQANRENLRDVLGAISQKHAVLVMGSTPTQLVDANEQMWLREEHPEVQVEMFEAGHSIHREDVEGFLNSLKEFLGAH